MTLVYYISHPNVTVNPAIAIPLWDLSDTGQKRLEVLLAQPWLESIQAVYSSDEQKAKMAASQIAQRLGLKVTILPELGEIDRSATGYLPPAELEPVIEALYANPEQSIRGWERAVDAQQRNVKAVTEILQATSPTATIAIVGHGGVGTLLMSAIKGAEITRTDGPPGQGYFYVFEVIKSRTGMEWHLLQEWKPIDHKES